MGHECHGPALGGHSGVLTVACEDSKQQEQVLVCVVPLMQEPDFLVFPCNWLACSLFV